MGADLLQILLKVRYALADLAAIHLELCLTATTKTDAAGAARSAATAAGLAGEVRPLAGEAGKPVFKLSELNLQHPFRCVRMLGEDIEDERSPVEHQDLVVERLLKLPLMARRELIIEDDDICTRFLNERLELIDLARSDERFHVGMVELLRKISDNLQASRR